jgi:hypothetical protein
MRLPFESVSRRLGDLGFKGAEAMVVLGLFSLVRPESDTVIVPQKRLAELACTTPITVRKTVERMVQCGLGFKREKNDRTGYKMSVYDVKKFREAVFNQRA